MLKRHSEFQNILIKMKVLHGQQLVQELRKLCDSVLKRLWIAVPYIGSPTSIRKILGKNWYDNPSVSVKLLTDATDLTCIDTETIQLFHDRDEIKSLQGLHAKLYIIDDKCLLTSANLTNTAFTKRHEIGILLDGTKATDAINIFLNLWKLADNLNPEKLNELSKKKIHSEEESDFGLQLPKLYDLPSNPGALIKNLEKKFLNYNRLIADYNDFTKKYAAVQRIWKNKPINLEVDGFFNYLYHHAPRRPSYQFANKKARQLTLSSQSVEIKKWALKYRKWNEEIRKKERGEDDIAWRMRVSRRIRQLLSPKKIMTLKGSGIREALQCTNSINSDPRNLSMIFKYNEIKDIKLALNELVNGDGQLAARMNSCNEIKNLGIGAMSEIIGLTYPNKYPMLNKNSKSGLRFFGYNISIN
jgi:phosphatidylserine/phosphatidylglycerophosphate/cardiolipin synthase-like enzyme